MQNSDWTKPTENINQQNNNTILQRLSNYDLCWKSKPEKEKHINKIFIQLRIGTLTLKKSMYIII